MHISGIRVARLQNACVVIHRCEVVWGRRDGGGSLRSVCPSFLKNDPSRGHVKLQRNREDWRMREDDSRSSMRTAAGGVCPLHCFFTRGSVLVSAGIHLIAARIICRFLTVVSAVVEMSRLVKVVVFLVVAVVAVSCTLTEPVTTCESSRLRQGCRIQEGGCLCGTGCDTDYRYSNKLECEAALRGRSRDPCNPNPCLHRGQCLQVFNSVAGYTCLCTGTNYYGDRCETRCPRRSSLPRGQKLPVQCIVI